MKFEIKTIITCPVNYGAFLLRLIGRATYKLIFWILKLIGSSLIQVIKALVQLIKLIKNIKWPRFKLPAFKLPKFKFPSFRLPSFKKPRRGRPLKKPQPKKLKFKFKFKFPTFRFKAWHLITGLVLLILGLSFYFYILKDLPDPKVLKTKDQILTTKIYDRHGELLYKIYNQENRSLVKLGELPQHFIQATLAAEDADFYSHNGFSWRGILRSLNKIITQRQIQGGSTITQQLVKNALLSSEKTLQRKLKEVLLSMLVELSFSKDEILQMYFNEIPYGGMAYGAEEAAQTYFNKSIREVNLAEAALLAGLPAAPTRYSPFGAHPELAQTRKNFVINRLLEEKYISPLEAEKIKSDPISLATPHNHIQAPHFVMYVKDLLAKKYGTRQVEQGGLQVTTSLDLNQQLAVETIVQQELDKVKALNINNGAALVTRPETGEILAMVGSKNYWDTANDGNVNVTLSLRQPGSSIKPVNYVVALENGYTPATVLADTPITYNFPGSPPYSPRNYDNRFHGHISLRNALANSYNVPAVKVLYSYGIAKMIAKGQAMGISTWTQPDRYGLALTLGGAEVKMVDMAVAYGTLANLGLRIDLHPILEVKNAQGKVLEKSPFSLQNEKVISPQIAYLITDILSDNQARAAAFGFNSQLNIPNHQVAVKTGTSNNKRDNWTLGYTQDYVVSVWVGNNDNTPMSQVASGVSGASPIWNQIMTQLLAGQPPHHFVKPGNLIEVKVCSFNGLLPCEGCPSKTELFTPGTEPKVHCDPEQMKQMQEKQNQERDKLLEGISTNINP